MIITVKIDIEVPPGATHYYGTIFTGLRWLKCRPHAEWAVNLWSSWDEDRKTWMHEGEVRPHWCKEIESLSAIHISHQEWQELISRINGD